MAARPPTARSRMPDPERRLRAIARAELAGVPPLPAARALRALERLRATFGPGIPEQRWTLLWQVQAGELRTARELERFHEVLAFAAAYPDDPVIEVTARLFLLAFDQRFARALARHGKRLENSGMAGTDTVFGFFAPAARWLALRWPSQLTIAWKQFTHGERLAEMLPHLAQAAEVPALDEWDLELPDWIARFKGRHETDAAWVIRRFAELPVDDALREMLYDAMDLPVRLTYTPGVPSRTHAHWPVPRVHHPTAPLAHARPDLKVAAFEAPRSVRVLAPREGAALIDLARGAMVTRDRDLDAFSYGDPHDVRLVDFGDGLQFGCVGVLPERRLLLESVYAYLTLKNGVPIGYVLTSALYGSSEIAYNVFDTFRGVEAAPVYGKVLAMTHALFGSDTFTIFPYQLGDGNDEAIESGAWWFYRKLGFRPRDRAVLRIAQREEACMRRNSKHRSSAATLRRLARENLYWQPGAARPDVIGRLPLANVGLAVSRFLAERFPTDRTGARATCAAEAAARLGVRAFDGWSAGERLAWERWAPLVLAMPGLGRWNAAERRSLVAVVRAKGGRHESDFVRRFDAHAKLRNTIVEVLKDAAP